jgi:ferredoxin
VELPGEEPAQLGSPSSQLDERWSENVSGRYWVNKHCIDCDLCRTTAPRNFERSDDGYSYVARQPESEQERIDCLTARNDCPVVAIQDHEDPD